MEDNGGIPYDKPKKEPVSVAWQAILCVILPFYWIYALYRIKRVGKGVLVYLGTLVGGIGVAYVFSSVEGSDMIVGISVIIALYGGGIVLLLFIVKWTMDWNEKLNEFNP